MVFSVAFDTGEIFSLQDKLGSQLYPYQSISYKQKGTRALI